MGHPIRAGLTIEMQGVFVVLSWLGVGELNKTAQATVYAMCLFGCRPAEAINLRALGDTSATLQICYRFSAQ